jgi:hypothetical protein
MSVTVVRSAAAVAAQAAAAQAASPAAGHPRSTAPRHEPFRQPSVQPVALAPQELSRVTDHVIQQLDRRLLSYRERTGNL